MDLHEKLNHAIKLAEGHNYPGVGADFILMHDVTYYDLLVEYPVDTDTEEYRNLKKCVYRGIKVYRSEDMELNKFIVK